ncbi:MAG: Rieske (2Fe-2S) protein [Vicinamibacterales bacterium]
MSERIATLSAPESTRRQFCAQACQAASLAAAATFAAACGGGSPTSPSSGSNAPQLSSVNGTVSGRTVSVTIDASGPLAANGSAALIQSSLGQFLINRVSDTSYTVLTAVCTHQSCTVSGFQSNRFVCPCHGSQFTTSGSVANGPATQALRSFAAQFANGVVTFSA